MLIFTLSEIQYTRLYHFLRLLLASEIPHHSHTLHGYNIKDMICINIHKHRHNQTKFGSSHFISAKILKGLLPGIEDNYSHLMYRVIGAGKGTRTREWSRRLGGDS